MTPHLAPSAAQRVRHELAKVLCAELPADLAGPIRAGMRARAVADVCVALDLPALLIDATGRVLHVTDGAQSLLAQGGFTVVSSQLLGRDARSNAAIVSAISCALTEPAGPVADSAGEGEDVITGLAFYDSSPDQLMRGVLILGSSHGRDTLQLLSSVLSAVS